MLEKIKYYFPEIIIFSFALLTRFIRLDFPKGHMFDEVYHVFTAQQIYKNNPAAWEWWNVAPQGFAYEWTHPPLSKEFMALAIMLFGDSSFAWRFFSALFGFGIIVLMYLISKKLFKDRLIALFAAFAASLEGLLLVMGRIGMNDSYFVFFSLLSLLMFLEKRKILMALALGLAVASKWTGLFVILSIVIFYLYETNKEKFSINKLKKIFILFFLIPSFVYVLSYLPFFFHNHQPPRENYSNIQTFIELQRQMFYYHTNLFATHAYQSTPKDWIFNLRPVWMFSDYKNNLVSNIYSLGNPLFVWGGLIGIIFMVYKYLKRPKFNLFIVLFSYFIFFIPWTFSPRIMFNYHYLLSSSFLAIAIGFLLNKLVGRKFIITVFIYIVATSILFFYFYPLWSGIYVEKELYNSYFWLKSWR